jgi:hypothetical protein
MEQVAAFDKLREGGISALVRLERAVKSFANAARRDPSGDHAGEQKEMTVSLQHCNDRVEAIRTSSLKCWPGIAVRRSSGAYRDTVDDEVSLEDAIDSLCDYLLALGRSQLDGWSGPSSQFPQAGLWVGGIRHGGGSGL